MSSSGGVYDRLESQLRRFPSTVAAMMPSGAIPATGDILVQPDLGSTLRQIAEDGAASFYRGEFADRLEQYSREENGWLRRADLQSYECEERAPISVEYNGNTIYAQPPVSQGCALLEEIRILDDTNWAHFDPASPEAIVLMVGAKRLAFADLRRFIADPAVGGVSGWRHALGSPHRIEAPGVARGTARRRTQRGGDRLGRHQLSCGRRRRGQ